MTLMQCLSTICIAITERRIVAYIMILVTLRLPGPNHGWSMAIMDLWKVLWVLQEMPEHQVQKQG